MKNKFKGTCYRCGKDVLPGEGHVETLDKRRRTADNNYVFTAGWRVQHKDCAIKYRHTDVHYIKNPIKP